MSKNFKKCPNGHYYDSSLDSCPYCPSVNSPVTPKNNGTSTSGSSGPFTTEYDPENGLDYGDDGKTQEYTGSPISGFGPAVNDGKTGFLGTDIFDEENDDETKNLGSLPERPVISREKPENKPNNTQIYRPEIDVDAPMDRTIGRKLVGWLVSYTITDFGTDFRLYEGRNIIGRDYDCDIVIPDFLATGRHAILLYRNGKYSITDQQSSNGTYVNDEDIELDPRYLKDGDVIRIGKTVLKFRSSL